METVIPVHVFAYAMAGAVVAVACFALEDAVPGGTLPAIQFGAGLLWPLVLLVGACVLLVRAARCIAGGYAVLWRHWRESRPPRIPKAQARARRGGS
jgi:hypothetical protein